MLGVFVEKVFIEMLATKKTRFSIVVILALIRRYSAYPLSYRHLEEMMRERGVFVGHSLS